MNVPDIRYAKTGGISIAYQIYGEGASDLVIAPGFVSNIEIYWEEPNVVRWLEGLGKSFRVILFDKRGTGLSDHATRFGGMEDRMDDLRAVLDAVGVQKAAVMGLSEGGTLAAMFAASHPDRCSHLILMSSFAKFRSWVPTDDQFDYMLRYFDTAWGRGEGVERYAPSMRNNNEYRRWVGRFERMSASPSTVAAMMRINREIDISDTLAAIHVPTLIVHRAGDNFVKIEGSRDLANGIMNSKFIELGGKDHHPWLEVYPGEVVDLITNFAGSDVVKGGTDRRLATVLFTDIVLSTQTSREMGDHSWKQVITKHNEIIRADLSQWRGQEIKTLGDGFLAMFDGPGRAVHCALDIVEHLSELDINVRFGVHTGEVEIVGADIQGIAVNTASRVVDAAGPNEVFVSSTVKDLTSGSGISFESKGKFALRGLGNDWSLYQAQK